MQSTWDRPCHISPLAFGSFCQTMRNNPNELGTPVNSDVALCYRGASDLGVIKRCIGWFKPL